MTPFSLPGNYGYTYDQIYRLIDADNPTTTDEAFTYDAVGNRLTDAGVTGDWSYNTNNELLGYDDLPCEYDANGNMIRKTSGGQVTNYTYNLENRLTRVENGTGEVIAEYYYDPFGRRLWKEVSGVRTCFHYSEEGLIGEYDATGTETKTHGYKPDSTWTTDPLFMKEDGQYFFYHNDHLGTPQKMTSVNGAVVWSVKYESFGKAEVDAGSVVENNLRFPGQYEDVESGLCYNYFRYYGQNLGRYLRTDLMGLVSRDVNLYLYAGNNASKFIDEYGLKKKCNQCQESKFSLPVFMGCILMPGAFVGATEVVACLACFGKVVLPVPEWMSCVVCGGGVIAQIGAILKCIDKATLCVDKY